MNAADANSDSFTVREEDSKLNEEYYENKQVFDNTFIKSNFCPVKFSRGDIKHLASDFEDQTLGGHREYREELINGRLAKVYIYTIKIIKYENETLEIIRKQEDDTAIPLIIVENNLVVPFNEDLVRSRDISLNNSPLQFQGESTIQGKRGRPRKYPVGKEPYKVKKRFAANCRDEIPENARSSGLYSRRDENSMFSFNNQFNNQMQQNFVDFGQPPSPIQTKSKREVSDFLEDYLNTDDRDRDTSKNKKYTENLKESNRLFNFY